MRVVDLESVNHENICCLNTAIIIFIFGRRRGLLAQLLKKIDEPQQTIEELAKAPSYITAKTEKIIGEIRESSKLSRMLSQLYRN